jgi:phosphate starvation-inducible PhoH-like protein
MIEEHLHLKISNRGNRFRLEGDKSAVQQGQQLIENLYAEVQKEKALSPESVHLSLSSAEDPMTFLDKNHQDDKVAPIGSIRTRKSLIKPRGKNQKKYIDLIRQHDINFGVGPAGTGKTYLAVACAVEALEKEQVERILLVRPAVEAGEKLGFLPGDLSQKVDPYLRPLYDALYEMLGFERVDKLIEKHVIEIAPLAYMRGRTLNNAFIILDESQNTTREQMKMFLTRIGFGSTAVITGDVTQVDLPKGVHSGLKHSLGVLEKVEGISFTFFASKDVVRHKLVQRIVDAYDVFDQSQSDSKPE